MTSYEAIKELQKRENERGIAPMAIQNCSVQEVVCFIDLCGMDNEPDEQTMWADDLEERLNHLCNTGYERDKFLKALFPEEELVHWG
jgi:hypothetical protein